MKINRLRDIPQLTSPGSWECDYHLCSIIPAIDKWVAEQGLNLDPDFQRDHVWTVQQQQEYMLYWLRGGKTARVLYFNNPNWMRAVKHTKYDEFVLVDGKQRLKAIRDFVSDKFTVCGKFFTQFEDYNRLSENTFRLNVNHLSSRKSVLQWYIEMNTSGVQHSEEDINKVKLLLEKEM